MAISGTVGRTLENNLVECNRILQKVLYFSFAIPIVFLILIKNTLLFLPFEGYLVFCSVIVLINIIEYVLNKENVSKNIIMQHITMYFGLISLVLITGMTGSFSIVPFYFAYILPALLSSIYLKKDVTNFISLLSFVIMLVSFWFRTYHIGLFSKTTGELYSHRSTYVIIVVGLIMEYVFAYFVSLVLATRSSKTMRAFSVNLENKNVLLKQLEESTDLLVETKQKRIEYNERIQENQLKTIEFVAEVLGSHDLFTGNHIAHTRTYVVMICEELYREGLYTDILTEENIQLYSTAAFLHDIGKVHLPESILNSAEKFTDEEYAIMKTHVTEGKKLLSYLPKIDDGYFNNVAIQMAYSHHEKWNGTGYPLGLKGEEIPLPARIMAAADVLDALIGFRLYKKSMSVDEAMQVFINEEGAHFEPCIAEAVVRSRDKIDYLDRQFRHKEEGANTEELEWWQAYHRAHAGELK